MPNARRWPPSRRWAVLAGGIAAVGLCILLGRGQLSAISPAARDASHAEPEWLLAVAVATLAGYLAATLALRAAATCPLPIGRTLLVQLAGAAANRVTPAGMGAKVVNVGYLESAGESRAGAVAAVSATGAAGLVMHLTATLVLAAVVLNHSADGHRGAVSPLLALLAIVAFGVGIARVRHRGRTQVSASSGPVRAVVGHLRDLAATPRRAFVVLAGSGGVTLASALGLVAAAHSYGLHLDTERLVALYVGGTTATAAVPTPGATGAVEVVLTRGLERLGAAAAPALATVLTFRLLTYWLPVVPGLAARRALRRAAT